MDTTKLKGAWEKVKDFFKNMSTKVRIILGAALAAIIILAAALLIWSSNQPYTTLFTGLNATEISSILGYFQDNGITDYRLEGDSILVRAEQESVLTAQLAMAGYPKSGALYDTYFNNVGTMSTSSEQATAWLVAVQERLQAGIRNLDGVVDAQVDINLGEERTYVFENVDTTATASVILTLRDDYTLTDQQAEAIRGIVSHAIKGMTIDTVYITDQRYNTYSGSDTTNLSDSNALKRKLEEHYNNLIRTQVLLALTSIYGEDNVRAAVTTTVDVNRRYIDSTSYSQPEGSYENGGLIGRDIEYYYITREGLEPVGGVVGTTTNSDLPTYVGDLEQSVGDGDTAGSSHDRENKIDETHEQIEVAACSITGVSVAVTINSNANTAASVEIETLRSHVAAASGIGGENPEQYVSVLMAPFLTEPATDTEREYTPEEVMIGILIIVSPIILLVVLLIVILSMRRKKRKKQEAEEAQRILEEQQQQAGEIGSITITSDMTPEEVEAAMATAAQAAATAPTGGADIMEINTEKSMELRKSVRQFVQTNPEVAAQMLKAWLRGEEDTNG